MVVSDNGDGSVVGWATFSGCMPNVLAAPELSGGKDDLVRVDLPRTLGPIDL